MESYTKIGYFAPIRFEWLAKNHTGGGQNDSPHQGEG